MSDDLAQLSDEQVVEQLFGAPQRASVETRGLSDSEIRQQLGIDPFDPVSSDLMGLQKRFTPKQELEYQTDKMANYAIRGLTSILDIGPLAWNANAWLMEKVGALPPTRATYPSQIIAERTGLGDVTPEPGTEEYYDDSRPLGFTIELLSSGFGIKKLAESGLEGSMELARQVGNFSKAQRTKSYLTPKALEYENRMIELSAIGGGTASLASGGDPAAEAVGSLILPLRAMLWDTGKAIWKASGKTARAFASYEAKADVALDSILNHASNREEALKNIMLAYERGETGSLATLSKDEGIMGYEKRLGRNPDSGDYALRLKNIDEQTAEIIHGKAQAIVNSEDGVEGFFAKYVTARLNAINSKHKGLYEQAAEDAKTTMVLTDPGVSTEKARRVLNVQLMQAEELAKRQERSLWDDVGGADIDAKALTKEVSDMIKREFNTDIKLRNYRKGLSDEIEVLEGLAKKGKVDVREFIDLRSSILQKLRELAVDGKSNGDQKHFASEFQAIMLKHIDKSEVSQAYKNATAFTKRRAETFNNTYFDSNADLSKELGKKHFKANDEGAEQADELIKASGFNEGILGAAAQNILAEFTSAAVKNGAVDIKHAERFLERNAAYLRRDEFQQVRQQIEEAISSQQVSEMMKSHLDQSRSIKQKTQFKNWFGGEPGNSIDVDPVAAVSSVVRRLDSAQEMRSLYRMAKRGGDGAVAGLQRNVIDAMIEQNALTSLSKRKQFEPVIKEAFKDNPEVFENIKAVFSEMDNLMKKSKAPIPHEQYEQALLLVTAGKIAGARIGAQIGTTPLIAAGLGGKLAEQALSKLPHKAIVEITEEMMLNPGKFAETAKRLPKVETVEQAAQIFHAWLAAAGIQAVSYHEE